MRGVLEAPPVIIRVNYADENEEVLIWLQDIFLVQNLNQIAIKIIVSHISTTKKN